MGKFSGRKVLRKAGGGGGMDKPGVFETGAGVGVVEGRMGGARGCGLVGGGVEGGAGGGDGGGATDGGRRFTVGGAAE